MCSYARLEETLETVKKTRCIKVISFKNVLKQFLKTSCSVGQTEFISVLKRFYDGLQVSLVLNLVLFP